MDHQNPPPPMLTVSQVAAALNVHRRTVLRRIDDGSLPGSIRTSRYGAWRIPAAALSGFLTTECPDGGTPS